MGRARGSRSNRDRLFFSVFKGFLVPLFCLSLNQAYAQQSTPPQTPDSASQIPEVRTTPGVGNLPSSTLDPSSLIRQTLPGAAKVSPAPAQLSLPDAIRLALQNNLATLSAQEQRRAATGFSQQARSALLPNISGATYQANITEKGSYHSTMRTERVNIDQARDQLADLINLASEGGEVIIVENGKALARLIGASDSAAYKSLSPNHAEFSSDEESLAWDADGWEEIA